ncbi:bifunctional glutamate N-acetyltransferase/amino-acid acetyltransferase ArgJ [Chloroflexus sp.]|uniref:bifunctional glutamate N-acetyltransferase/amino-acid acetyltransferase ArgJ n=1 Tax=Chloroflexus sp. TaxID=1904827 RepID=UPI00298F18B8|nr:bifunctional glutamate N-acetyltransferase/amino-acid acetyltransferase ArgJ [Chloroflexus sp.]MCS6888221.1 bifunctional glutamate N-acetyltransferase/amino-acid acetyltransferase ArgJ [Chloroflexus sp.]MDW8404393.1 bifunctional glutamate N-acetyltransferase/amino-acid acetyltransferase ArgJ [Chloroflexus sp.]
MISFLADGHVASPRGWRAAVAACGIKYANRDDLALVVSDRPATAAAVFTTNAVKAAPVLYDMALMAQGGDLRAVVINAGNANACTGVDGDAAAAAMARAVEQALDLPPNSAFVMSTGTIGVPMPVEKITRGIAEAATRLSPDHGLAAARAIMTTDTRPKHCAVTVTLPDGSVITIGGMAKGAGMIHPNMATMLAVVTTDAAVPRAVLDAAMRQALEVSFNSISIDGDTSTNDTLLVMANGASGAPPITDLAAPAGAAFLAGLTAVCQHLAHAIVRDGEGATRFVTITVRGAVNNAEAKQAAMTIARSPLVKTALFGADPNWGRVLCAIGYSGATVDPNRVVLHFGGMRVLEGGLPLPFDEKAAHKLLDVPEITIDADLGLGDGQATVWTCDFSYDYVRINAEYRT